MMTEAVRKGLPPHIASPLGGSINKTQILNRNNKSK